jgi:hypothetical protein
MFPHFDIITVQSFIQRLSDRNKPPIKKGRKTYTIKVRSSTVVGHVGYHLSMAVMKSRAGSDFTGGRQVLGKKQERLGKGRT